MSKETRRSWNSTAGPPPSAEASWLEATRVPIDETEYRIRAVQQRGQERRRGEVMMKFKRNYGLVVALCLAASIAWADSLKLKNGSLIHCKFQVGTESDINFQVGSSVQKYNITDITSLTFDSERVASNAPASLQSSLPDEPGMVEHDGMKTLGNVTIPAGTRISCPRYYYIWEIGAHANRQRGSRDPRLHFLDLPRYAG